MITAFFFDKPVQSNYLRLLRCGTGLILLFAMLALWPDFCALYGPDGTSAGDLPYQKLLNGLHRATGWPYPALLHGTVVLYAGLCALMAFTPGFRAAAALLLPLHTILFTAEPLYGYGFDFLASVALTYCIVLPGSPSHAWARPGLRALQLHLCLIYLFSGLTKALGHTWRNGEALYKALGLPATPPLFPPDAVLTVLGAHPGVLVAGGWVVLVLETGYAAGIWHRVTYPWFLYGVILLHTGIALFIGLYHFSALMILFNCCTFLLDPPAQLKNRNSGRPWMVKSTSADCQTST